MSYASGDSALIAPYVPTPEAVSRRMLELAGLRRGELLVDLGCGDGRIAIMAANDFGAVSEGVDLNGELVAFAASVAARVGVDVRFLRGNLLYADVSRADVVALYLGLEANEIVRPKLEAELRKGARVVCHDYPVPSWRSARSEILVVDGREHAVFVYVLGDHGSATESSPRSAF